MENRSIPSFNIIGIAIRTSNQNNQAAKDIPELWARFFENDIMSRIPNKVSNELYCVYTEYERDHTLPYTTLLGCKVAHLDDLPEDMDGLRIEESRYHHVEAEGNLAAGIVYDAWLNIWEADLPRAFSADFEIYGEKAQNPEQAKVDIFIALQ
ncbi:MAG: AraC family transcriptional regulator [Sphingobacterium sp.]|jgi:predicted transcriptional regulator YdeE|uniref:GyrI-like domain-containing protein n=1 Tax=Sphingobacterium sp. CZ-UAM TaxID=1933868 RepID=UPI00098694CB|nr:effector binding domain-containing protein [Sphingobacterium sp. CZ-UAM]MDF2515532.1 AraC family transcriptional regulator [Sphingobacterium sp.]OOG19455.1 AraC family transcriptional regulator [Sphingobacterium sp. CZ-UAM]